MERSWSRVGATPAHWPKGHNGKTIDALAAKGIALSQSARTQDGSAIDAATIGRAEWESLKQSSMLGQYLMPCCDAPAVLKTSINGLHFFAHPADECATAPETKWHKAGKAAVLASLRTLGIKGHEEAPGKPPESNAMGGPGTANDLTEYGSMVVTWPQGRERVPRPHAVTVGGMAGRGKRKPRQTGSVLKLLDKDPAAAALVDRERLFNSSAGQALRNAGPLYCRTARGDSSWTESDQ